MDICVVGTGYVGLVSGVCFSDLGNRVTCVDVDESKIKKLLEGKSPIYEPGIEDFIQKNLNEGRLFFTTDLKKAMESAQIILIAVGTPRKQNGEADLTYIENVAESIGQNLQDYKIIVTKSTVPVGTGKIIKEIISRHAGDVKFDVASNPEFLREGSAIYDTLNMERAVIGVESEKAANLLKELHKPLTSNIVLTDIETAEMIKYASNAFLATKISFINEIANVCELLGADVTKVAEGMGYDKRIGNAFLQAGIGYGGSCFPKDTSALVAIAEQAGYDFRIVKDVEQVNKEQRFKVVDKLKVALKNDLKGKKISILGLAFKPNTDDMRDAPSVDVIPILQNEGAEVVAYDPVASENAQKVIPNLQVTDTMQEAILNSDAIVILTEWNEFKEMDLTEVARLVKQKIIIDGRNIFSIEKMEYMKFYYASIGRKTVSFN
ncbi:UDP-glucose dehydrogenase family protein [Metabacillus sediminilitoris]|uniref:UDP-glucose 6-dehydrogenase n=1 Tax=Metabacillus sediminilitoris TaxID=2567941 RepID=A0A4V3WFS8_9BACI|nr:UDP-glucose/GDP-mannose dehydrogenase family protein [Metabacillus sediminilitoris]QGQ48160.1 nucleotide sugar dehydrogenase [Metabacillus sediminilitoris]THF81477.1 UDP-glucose/GDP-mannose dehydrogenase family protein [Metabacillus sediminilitoris]